MLLLEECERPGVLIFSGGSRWGEGDFTQFSWRGREGVVILGHGPTVLYAEDHLVLLPWLEKVVSE